MANQAIVNTISPGERLGFMYKRWTLDCVVTIAHAVSLDFSARPELYQQLSEDTATKLTDLQSNYGHEANFPDMDIRNMLMKPVFGGSDGHGSGNDGSPFQTYRLPVLAAAADFSENAQPTAFPMLRERIRSAIVPFKTHMVDLAGASLAQTEIRMRLIFDDTAVPVLKDPGVSGVFGINDVNPAWPLQSIDGQGAKLIAQITTQLSGLPYGVISRELFVRMQRIAENGAESIRIIVDKDTDQPQPDFDLDPLIARLYAWGSDLGLVGGARPQQQVSPSQAQVVGIRPPYVTGRGGAGT